MRRVREWQIKKLRLIALFVVLAAAVVSANVAAAGNGPPTQVTIVSNMTFNPNGFNFGDFTASGPAVDRGLICAHGSVVDTDLLFTGYKGRNGFNVQVRKTFTCDGGATFDVKLQVHAEWDGTETFSWVVQGGTGLYSSLRGSGSGATVPHFSGVDQFGNPIEVGNTNTYTGFIVG